MILISLRHHRDDWRHEIDDYIFHLLTHKCPLNSDKSFFLEYALFCRGEAELEGNYNGSEDWDWYYSRLSEDLQSGEMFVNELKEIVYGETPPSDIEYII